MGNMAIRTGKQLAEAKAEEREKELPNFGQKTLTS
jgi:hypothetical protein